MAGYFSQTIQLGFFFRSTLEYNLTLEINHQKHLFLLISIVHSLDFRQEKYVSFLVRYVTHVDE